jgi:serine/threonine-protein kinase RsbW
MALHAVIRTSMSQYRLSFPSSLDHCRELRQWICVIAHIEGYSEAFMSALELTVHEAFVNAVRHGNRGDSSRSVTVRFEAGQRGGEPFLEVRIRDCGEGFQAAPAISKASSPEGFVATGGRGLFLINHFVKSLEIEKQAGGCELVLRYIPY